MRLYFLRHAHAEPGSPDTPDFKRALTPAGIAHTRRAAYLLNALGVDPDRLFTSPLIRARQTADIVGQALGVAVQVRREVGPGFGVHAVEALTRDLGSGDEVIFVGHEPDFSGTVAALTGGRVVMKKAGIARVDVVSYQPLAGELIWLIAPKLYGKPK